ncbi:hypothetical protein TKK_0007258 [Trichogramma kaykai]|uniref:DNA/RNA non-specific endonuclease/pyrophosphatase/phosphodiesterase domain-containing protein n=1 Tax=Trichogramma kaykai TaxID=54128 RepID=A0ABD2X9J5_9HYME
MHYLVFATLLLITQFLQVLADCGLKVKTSFHDKSPLLLDHELNFIYPPPSHPEWVRLRWFQDRLVYCPGGTIHLGENRQLLARDETHYQLPPVVRCIKDDILELEDQDHVRFNLEFLSCNVNPEVVDWATGETCGRGSLQHLGFPLDSQLAKPSIKLCYVNDVATTTWAYSVIPAAIENRQVIKSNKETFSKGKLFEDITVAKYYVGCVQVETFMDIFREEGQDSYHMDDGREPTEEDRKKKQQREDELREYVSRYIRPMIAKKKKTDPELDDDKMSDTDVHAAATVPAPDTSDDKLPLNYLVKGHLIAKADKFYAAEQYVTYFYANAVPMWNSINNGNWKHMEDKIVRPLAATKGDIEVWVGAFGVLRLEGKDIYLGKRKRQEHPVMPVPKILFKVAYSRQSNQGLVFLAANNPYLEDAQVADYIVCPEYPRCRELHDKFNNKDRGFMYCCSIPDFLANPEVRTLGLPIGVPNDVAPIL